MIDMIDIKTYVDNVQTLGEILEIKRWVDDKHLELEKGRMFLIRLKRARQYLKNKSKLEWAKKYFGEEVVTELISEGFMYVKDNLLYVLGDEE